LAAPGNDNLANAQSIPFDGLTGLAIVDANNIGASRETGEMQHYNTTFPGEKTVWFKWTAPVDLSAQIEVGAAFYPVVAVYKSAVQSPTFQDLTQVMVSLFGYRSDEHKSILRFRAVAGTTYYIAVGNGNLSTPTTEGLFGISFSVNKLRYSSVFNVSASERASMAVYRPAEGRWYVMKELNETQPAYYKFGLSGAPVPDQPIPADYDGDSLTDLAVTRNIGGFKYWYITNRFSDFFDVTLQWGLATDKALTGDFDRDGRADLVAIRNNGQNLVWYIRQSRQNDYRVLVFGANGDQPIIGDFDGDGATDVAVTRLVNGEMFWHILKSGFNTNPNATFTEYAVAQHGAGSDAPVTEDFDGDGKTDVAVFRHVSGNWLIRRSSTNELQETHFGQFLDKPQPADFDGDGIADLVVYRPSEGNWYFWLSKTNAQAVKNWGIASDIPVASLNTATQ
jgi:hypothetical protein